MSTQQLVYNPEITVKDLMNAGVHLGHSTNRWNPKMAPYIYGVRNSIHIFNLSYTSVLMQKALSKMYEVTRNNGKILFVGTKIQATDIVTDSVSNMGQYYIAHKWLGGLLTNWKTISKSIKKLENLEKTLADETQLESFTKKEILNLTRRRNKLLSVFGGIKNMKKLPDMLVVLDTNKEHLAIQEAKKLGITVAAVVDSNSSTDGIDFVIPGNDDAIRSIKYYFDKFSDAVLLGLEHSLIASGVDIGSINSKKDDNSKNEENYLQGVTELQGKKKAVKSSPAKNKDDTSKETKKSKNISEAKKEADK